MGESATLPPFPVDDQALDALEHALGGAYDRVPIEEDPTPVGAEFSFGRVLEFYSGHDDTLSVPDGESYTYHGPLYSEWDVMVALIGEVRRLRALCAGSVDR